MNENVSPLAPSRLNKFNRFLKIRKNIFSYPIIDIDEQVLQLLDRKNRECEQEFDEEEERKWEMVEED